MRVCCDRSFEEALLDIGTVLHRYDEDDSYAVYGFGGIPHGLKHRHSASVHSPMAGSPEECDASSEVVGERNLAEIPSMRGMRSVSSTSVGKPPMDRLSMIVEEEEKEKKREELPVEEEKPEEKEEEKPEEVKKEVKPEEVKKEVKPEEVKKDVKEEEKEEEKEEKPAEEVKEEEKEEEEKPEEEVKEEEKPAEEEKQEEENPEEVKPAEEEKEEKEKEKEEEKPTEEVKEEKKEEEKPEEKPEEENEEEEEKEEEYTSRTPLSDTEEGSGTCLASSLEKEKNLFVSSFQERLDQLRLDQSTVHPSAVQNLDSEINRTGAFPLNGNAENPYIQGANNVISAYKKMLRSLMPSYPTYFQDILRLAIA